MKHLFTGNTGAFFLFSPPFPVKEHNWVSWNNTCCGTIQETHILRLLLCLLRWYPANISCHSTLLHIQAHCVGYRCAVQSIVKSMIAPEFWWPWPKLMGLASSLQCQCKAWVLLLLQTTPLFFSAATGGPSGIPTSGLNLGQQTFD